MLNNALFENSPMSNFKKILESYNIKCDTNDCCNPEKSDFLVFHRLDLVIDKVYRAIRNNTKCKLILFAFEEPVVCGLHEEDILPFLDLDHVFCWRDDLLEFEHVVKANIPQDLTIPVYKDIDFHNRKAIIAIDGNKSSRHPNEAYSLRRSVIKELLHAGVEVDMYGRDWHRSQDSILKSIWLGEVERKLPIQSQYRLTLCIQNSKNYPGNICEKIFDAFKAGSIPIYHGAPNIEKYIDPNCFIDLRGFYDNKSLSDFVLTFTEIQYNEKRKAIDTFMHSESSFCFSGEYLARSFVGQIQKSLCEPKEATVRSAKKWIFQVFILAFRRCFRYPCSSKVFSFYLLVKGLSRLMKYYFPFGKR